MKQLLACLLLLGSGRSALAEPFSPVQQSMEAAFAVELALDRAQTVDIRDFCRGRSGCTLHETNLLLGRRPSVAAINRYFLLSAVAHALVSAGLPAAQRRLWQSTSLALEAAVIGHNKRLGLSLHF